jgi:putative oxidoreductase
MNLVRSVISLMERLPYSLVALLGRVAIGLVFWNSARTKVEGWDVFRVNEGTLQLFTDEYKLPIIPPWLNIYFQSLLSSALPPAFQLWLCV